MQLYCAICYSTARSRELQQRHVQHLTRVLGDMNDETALLLQLPVPLSAFVTIKLPVLSPAETTPIPVDSGLPTVEQRTIHMHKLWHTVNTLQPGGPLVCFPCSAAQCQVICHKVRYSIILIYTVQGTPVCCCLCTELRSVCNAE